ncbi:MAG: hypothetical protein V4508_00220 [Pseudomonadota bacterium]
MLLTGSCHCGNITFTLDWLPEPLELPARACGCSFCVKHGGVWTSCPAGALAITIRDAEQVSNYTFGTKTAQFHICTCCGVVPVVTSRIEDQLYAVVSVNAFNDLDRSMLRHSPASFDGESETERLARRSRGWIRDVRIMAPDAPGRS